jgi:hypothetical protein
MPKSSGTVSMKAGSGSTDAARPEVRATENTSR